MVPPAATPTPTRPTRTPAEERELAEAEARAHEAEEREHEAEARAHIPAAEAVAQELVGELPLPEEAVEVGSGSGFDGAVAGPGANRWWAYIATGKCRAHQKL
jgi:hypothetical protein